VKDIKYTPIYHWTSDIVLCWPNSAGHVGEGMGEFLGVSRAAIARGRGFRAPQFWGFRSIYAYTPCCRTTDFDVVAHRPTGKGLVFRGSATPPPQGAGSQRYPIFWIPFYLCVHFCRRTSKFDVVTHVGKGRVWSQPRLPSQESGVLALPNFRVLYLCLQYIL